MVFCHSNRKVTKTEVDTRERAIDVSDLTISFVFGGMWIWDLVPEKWFNALKSILMNHSSRILEGSNTESYVDCQDSGGFRIEQYY